MSLDSWLKHGRTVAGTALTVGSLMWGILAYANGTDGKAAKALEVAEQAAASVKAMADRTQAALEAERQAREAADKSVHDAVNTRLVTLEVNDRAQDTTLAVIREQMRQQSDLLKKIDTRQEVMIDRLGANGVRTRTVRDFPQ